MYQLFDQLPGQINIPGTVYTWVEHMLIVSTYALCDTHLLIHIPGVLACTLDSEYHLTRNSCKSNKKGSYFLEVVALK